MIKNITYVRISKSGEGVKSTLARNKKDATQGWRGVKRKMSGKSQKTSLTKHGGPNRDRTDDLTDANLKAPAVCTGF